MQLLLNQSDTIFTSPLQSPNSKQPAKDQALQFSSNRFKNESRSDQKPDYQSALQFADFIGLSPVSKAKKRQLSNVQRFFQTHSLKLQTQTANKINSSCKHMIKNDMQNRKVNFFDLKRILDQRSQSLKLRKSKQILKTKNQILSAQIHLKHSRVLSATLYRASSLKNEPFSQFDDFDNPQNAQLRIQTARQLCRKEEEKEIENKKTARYIRLVQTQKENRSKILKNISKEAGQNSEHITIDKSIENRSEKKAQKADKSKKGMQLRFKKQNNRFEYSSKEHKQHKEKS